MRLTLSTTDAGTDAAARTVTGTLAVFGPVGNGSIAPVRFEAGSIQCPADLKRVKLLIEHDTERPVGYLTESAATDQSVTGTFYLPPGESGDVAIQAAKDGLRDGLSVGLDIRKYHKDGEVIVVTESLLREVSLVAVPALDDARVTSVSATRQEGEGAVPEITTEETAPVAVGTEQAEQPQTTALPVVNASRNPQPITARSGSMDLAAAISTASEVLTTGSASRLTAALGQITVGDDAGEGVIRPQWVGELWEVSLAERPLIDALGPPRALTGLKVQGFRKQYGDLVDQWNPDTDAQIPSPGTFVTEPVEVDAKYFAGGNAIDRRFVDLGSAAFLGAWFTEATDDYKEETEAQAVTDFQDEATTVTAQPSLIAALDVLGRAAAGRGSNLDFILMGPAVWSQFLMLKSDEVPWWLKAQGQVSMATLAGSAAGIAFRYGRTLAPTALIAGDRRAMAWHEVNPPIQVQALDVPGAKIDLAVYGYGTSLVHDPASLFQTTVTAP